MERIKAEIRQITALCSSINKTAATRAKDFDSDVNAELPSLDLCS
jgi:hypothetical protein